MLPFPVRAQREVLKAGTAPPAALPTGARMKELFLSSTAGHCLALQQPRGLLGRCSRDEALAPAPSLG